jgi:hypothetical protein
MLTSCIDSVRSPLRQCTLFHTRCHPKSSWVEPLVRHSMYMGIAPLADTFSERLVVRVEMCRAPLEILPCQAVQSSGPNFDWPHDATWYLQGQSFSMLHWQNILSFLVRYILAQ